jgi:hypothetical protein
MAFAAAARMCSGVMKSGSPRLKSKTWTPSAFSCRAFAPAARVADGCTPDAIFEMGIIPALPGDPARTTPRVRRPESLALYRITPR